MGDILIMIIPGWLICLDHNDLVLAQLDNGTRIPARVLDLRMAEYDLCELGPKNFPLKKAMDSKPAGSQHALVILFDIANSWRWLPNNRLQLLDVMSRSAVQNGDSIFGDAFTKAKKFW